MSMSKFLRNCSDEELDQIQDRAILHNSVQTIYGEPVSEDAAMVADRVQDEKESRREH